MKSVPPIVIIDIWKQNDSDTVLSVDVCLKLKAADDLN